MCPSNRLLMFVIPLFPLYSVRSNIKQHIDQIVIYSMRAKRDVQMYDVGIFVLQKKSDKYVCEINNKKRRKRERRVP